VYPSSKNYKVECTHLHPSIIHTHTHTHTHTRKKEKRKAEVGEEIGDLEK